MAENYALGSLKNELSFTKEHLKNIKKSRESHPNFYFPCAEKVMKERICDLKGAIKILSDFYN